MHSFFQLLCKHLVHQSVLPNPRDAAKGFSHDFDTEVAFTRGVGTRMTCMLMTLINHAKSNRIEGRFQLFFEGSAHRAQSSHLIHNVTSLVSG